MRLAKPGAARQLSSPPIPGAGNASTVSGDSDRPVVIHADHVMHGEPHDIIHCHRMADQHGRLRNFTQLPLASASLSQADVLNPEAETYPIHTRRRERTTNY